MNLSVSKNSLYDYLFCALILVIPFSLKVPNIIMIALTLFFLADYKQITKSNFQNILKSQYLVLGFLILYWLIKGFITGSLGENKYSLLLPVILLPFLILKVYNFYRILFALVSCGFIIATRALYGIFNNYVKFGELLPFEGASINQILYMERPYLGFFLVSSVLIAVFLIIKRSKFKLILGFYSFYALLTIFLISARMALVTLGTIIVIYIVYYIKISVRKRLIYFSSFLLCLIIFITFNKNLQERLFISSNYQESIKNFERHEPRFIIWPCSYSISNLPAFNIFFGLDSEDRLDELLGDCYLANMENKHRANFFAATELNTHNQFVGTYLTSGIIGFSLLSLFFLLQLYNARRNFFKTAIVVSMFLFFLVENVLYRQVGIYFFALLLVLINSFDFECEGEEIGDLIN